MVSHPFSLKPFPLSLTPPQIPQASSSLLQQGYAIPQQALANLHRRPQRRRHGAAIPPHPAPPSPLRQHRRPRQHLRRLNLRRRRRHHAGREPRQFHQPRRLPLRLGLLRPEPRRDLLPVSPRRTGRRGRRGCPDCFWGSEIEARLRIRRRCHSYSFYQQQRRRRSHRRRWIT